MESGDKFQFLEDDDLIVNEKKRDRKSKEKEETKNGIDASELLKETRTRDRKRIKIFNEFASAFYGN